MLLHHSCLKLHLQKLGWRHSSLNMQDPAFAIFRLSKL